MSKKEKTGNARIIGFAIIASVIVIVTIIIVVKNRTEKVEINDNSEKLYLSENINENAVLEDKPSIAGNENVKQSDGIKVNNSPKISQDRSFENYNITNIKLEATKKGTVLTAKISSTSTEKLQGRSILIKFYNKSGELVSMMNGYIGQIKSNDVIDFRAESTSDLSNAYDMTIE